MFYPLSVDLSLDIQLQKIKSVLNYHFFFLGSVQEVVIDGQDKVFKDVIEPLESVSVNMIPTVKQDIRELGSPQEVCLLYPLAFLIYNSSGYCFPLPPFLSQNICIQ